MEEESEECLLDDLLSALNSDDFDKELGGSAADLSEPKTKNKQNEDEYFLLKIAANDLKVLEAAPSTSGVKSKSGTKSTCKRVDKKLLESNIHNGETDSSDDEENRDFQNRKYNEYGNEIKHMFSNDKPALERLSSPNTWKTKNPILSEKRPVLSGAREETSANILTDPFFGIRISKPLISSALLQDRMSGRMAITMAQVKNFVKSKQTDDWVIAGVIVDKSHMKTSQKDSQYIIFTLSDLKNELRTVSLFLFRNACKELWKTTVGTVIGVLNPSIMETREGSRHEATLGVDNHQKVMMFGQSKDFGHCKSLRKDGNKCGSFVNINTCEYCVYHVRQAYQNCARRSELQAKFAGGGLTALRNKVLGKNEVFYAGKSYMAVKPQKSRKLREKDERTLLALQKGGTVTLKKPVKSIEKKERKGSATSLDVSRAQRLKDLELLKKLNDTKGATANLENKTEFDAKSVSSGITLDESKKTALDLISKLKQKAHINFEKVTTSQKEKDLLSKGDMNNSFDAKLHSSKASLEDSKRIALELTSKIKQKTGSNYDNVTSSQEEDLLSQSNPDNSFDAKSHSSDVSLNESKGTGLGPISKVKKKNTDNATSSQLKVVESESTILHTSEVTKSTALSCDVIKPDVNLKVKNKTTLNEVSKSKTVTDFAVTSNSLQTENDNSCEAQKGTEQCEDNLDEILKEKSKSGVSTEKSDSNKKKLLSHEIAKRFVPKLTNPNETEVNNINLDINIETNSKVQLLSPASEMIPVKNKKPILLKGKKSNKELPKNVNKLKLIKSTLNNSTPSLSNTDNFEIKLTKSISRRSSDVAKQNALLWVQKNGPIKKSEKCGVKRFLESLETTESKKLKLEKNIVISDRFKKIMAMTSKHADLIEKYDLEQQEKYFNKLETKEKLEEKMMSTFKVDCKAVKCLTCKYTNFSAAERCKKERHVLKVFNAVKRFFKCGDCGYRTCSLEIVPLFSCKQCSSSKWERTTMMKEKTVHVGEQLSIRGGEQKFINSVVTDANINLLVPDEE